MFFNKKNKNKRGTTLVELTIVLAIIAIIAVMTVTMTVLVQKRVHLNTERDKMLSDIANIETLTKKWIVHYDNQDYQLWLYQPDKTKWETMGITDNKGKIYAQYNLSSDSAAIKTETIAVEALLDKSGETLYTLSFSDGEYKAQWFMLGDVEINPETGEKIRKSKVETRTYHSEYVTKVEYTVLSSDLIGQKTNNRRVVKMKVWYTDPRTHEQLSADFMFTTHAQAKVTYQENIN